MARHMKAASCRLLRSHAAVDGTPHRLMVPHTPPRPPWAAPRPREEANANNMVLRNCNHILRENQLRTLFCTRRTTSAAAALRRPAHAHTPSCSICPRPALTAAALTNKLLCFRQPSDSRCQRRQSR